MNSALIFHAKLTLKNTLKQALRKPIKLLGIILAVSYFMLMPLFMKDMIMMMGLDNPNGYVLMSSILTLYFIALLLCLTLNVMESILSQRMLTLCSQLQYHQSKFYFMD